MIISAPQVIYCNVTTSVDDIVQWVGVDLISTNCTDINCICAEQKRTVSYEIYNRLINSPDHDSATVAVHSVGLALCDTTVPEQRYTCTAQEMGGAINLNAFTVTVRIDRTNEHTSSTGTPSPSLLVIILPISATVIVAIVVFISVVAAYFAIIRLKSNRKLHDSSNTQWTLASSDEKEFPRNQLSFMEVLGKRCGHSLFSYYGDSTGEGQFGQVRKAQAIGIVPHDLTRNIVAVKSLKSMYCSVGQRH